MKGLGFAVAAAFIFTLAAGCAHAASLLSEQEARAKAIDILMGDPYGTSPEAVTKNIKQAQLLQDGNTKACGAKKNPAWEFHVVAETANEDGTDKRTIDGYLALDARTGEIMCASLPFLD